MRSIVLGLSAFFGVAVPPPALAQESSANAATTHVSGRSVGVEVVVEPAPGNRPSWCPSTDFNGARFICQPADNSAVPAPSSALPASGGAYDVALRLGNDLIWKGTMFLGGDGSSASISQNRTDSFWCQPEPPLTRASQSVNTSFSIRIGGSRSAGSLGVSAEITRPYSDPRQLSACTDRGPGTKTIRFETQVDLAGDGPIVLTGDAGLTLSIARLAR